MPCRWPRQLVWSRDSQSGLPYALPLAETVGLASPDPPSPRDPGIWVFWWYLSTNTGATLEDGEKS